MTDDPILKILIVDDTPENLFTMKSILRDLDIEVITASSGKEALSSVLRHDFSLILMDAQMPSMNGYETATLMRDYDRTKFTPIIFVTTNTSEDQHHFKGHENASVDFIFKPINPDILKSKVSTLLKVFVYERESMLLPPPPKSESVPLEKFRRLEDAYKTLEQQQITLIETEKVRALTEMTSAVSHEMKQPLNVIGLICQSASRDILMNRVDMEELGKDLNEVNLQIKRLTAIIDLMRMQGQPSSGDVITVVNINEIVENIVNWMGSQLEARNIELTLQLESNMPQIDCDPIRLGHALMKLAVNARESLEVVEDRPRRLRITTHVMNSRSAENEQARLVASIEDSGTGIPAAIQPQIFEPFFTTKGQDRRVGLGLCTALQIVEEHRGTIEFESIVDKGTTFKITLPVNK